MLVMTSNNTDIAVITDATAPASGRRVIYLSGRSLCDGATVLMNGTLFASGNGDIQGAILWTNVDSPGHVPGISGTEQVRGTESPTELRFRGVSIVGPFLIERYRIILLGGEEAGAFRGESEAYGVYDAHLSGTYRRVVERE